MMSHDLCLGVTCIVQNLLTTGAYCIYYKVFSLSKGHKVQPWAVFFFLNIFNFCSLGHNEVNNTQTLYIPFKWPPDKT